MEGQVLEEDMIVIPFTSCPFFFLIWIVKVLPDEEGLDTIAESLQDTIQEGLFVFIWSRGHAIGVPVAISDICEGQLFLG